MDLIDKVQKKACIRMAVYQHMVAHYFNTKVQGKAIKVGDLVLYQEKFPEPAKEASSHQNWRDPIRWR